MINPKPTERYQEKAIQLACVDWLSSNWGYRETFDDTEAVGARFDSVGDLKGQLLLVEFKVDVSVGMIRHASDRAGSLESKIAGALRGIYSGSADVFSTAANSVWDRASSPLVAIAARSFSDAARRELIDILTLRSPEWRFDFRIWRWAGAAVDVLASGTSPDSPSPEWLAEINIPTLIGRTPRAKNLNLLQMREKAIEAGVADMFDAFIAEARRCRMRIGAGRWSVRTGYPPSEGGTIFACYLDGSSEHLGLHVGMDAIRFADGVRLPGSPAPITGFLNLNRYLTTTNDVRQLFALLEIC